MRIRRLLGALFLATGIIGVGLLAAPSPAIADERPTCTARKLERGWWIVLQTKNRSVEYFAARLPTGLNCAILN